MCRGTSSRLITFHSSRQEGKTTTGKPFTVVNGELDEHE
jgi:hypothetical protein